LNSEEAGPLSTTQPRRLLSIVFLTLRIGWLCSPLTAQAPAQVLPKSSARSVGQLILAIHRKAEALKGSAGMRQGFELFKLAYKLPDYAVRYDDFVVVRLLYEATRDAGFWNLHWTITDQPPNSDRVWKQWRVVDQPSPLHPPRSPSAMNSPHSMPSWSITLGCMGLASSGRQPITQLLFGSCIQRTDHRFRVVVPTSQIFLDVTDSFGTRKFNPRSQKSIFEYRRRMSRILSNFPSHCLICFCAGWTGREARRIQPCSSFVIYEKVSS